MSKSSELVLDPAKTRDKIKAVEAESGVRLCECYQCGKCSAGCPVAFAMDIQPREVIHFLKVGLWDEVLKSKAPWLCAECSTCVSRCPHNVDLPRLMETIKHEGIKSGHINSKEAKAFNNTYLMNLKNFGRNNEALLAAFFNLKTGHFLQDMGTAPTLVLNGKTWPLPDKVKGTAEIRKIVAKCQQIAKEESK